MTFKAKGPDAKAPGPFLCESGIQSESLDDDAGAGFYFGIDDRHRGARAADAGVGGGAASDRTDVVTDAIVR